MKTNFPRPIVVVNPFTKKVLRSKDHTRMFVGVRLMGGICLS